MPQAIRTSYSAGAYVLSATSGWVGTSRPPPLIYAHVSGSSTELVTTSVSEVPLLNQLAQFFTVYVGDFGLEAWGNDTHIATIEAARTTLASAWGSTGQVTLVGSSMGGLGVLNYAKTYPANVRALVGIIPAVDLKDMQDNNRGGGASLIAAAYPGGTSVRDAHNPVTFAATMSSTIPMLFMTSPSDATCVPATHDAFVAARPQTQRRATLSFGHTGDSIAQAVPEVVRFARILA